MASTPASDAVVRNQVFYDGLWSRSELIRPERHNTWPLIAALLPACPERIEIGPGMLPRLPAPGTNFVDLSGPVIARLNAAGGRAIAANLTALPFPEARFDLAGGFDVFEHIDDDDGALREMSRVLKDGGTLILSAPLHQARWTEFDEVVGHVRRYEPAELQALLGRHHFIVEKSAVFGRKPGNRRIVAWGMRWLAKHPDRAMTWYNRVFLPLGLLLQGPLRFSPGFATTEAQGAVLVCRRVARAG